MSASFLQSWIWNGDTFDSPAFLPVTDRGVRHGLALFETVRCVDGHFVQWDAHIALLKKSARQAGWEVSPAMTEALAKWCVISQSLPSCVVRIYLTGGDGSPLAPVRTPRLFLMAEERICGPRTTPYHLMYSEVPYVAAPHGWKTASYWPHLRDVENAKQKQYDEALLFSTEDELVSAAMANVFVVHEGKLLTPRLSSGARPGVVRDWVLKNFGATEECINRDRLSEATEIFLTSSGIGVQSAVFGNANAHAKALEISHAYEHFVKQ